MPCCVRITFHPSLHSKSNRICSQSRQNLEMALNCECSFQLADAVLVGWHFAQIADYIRTSNTFQRGTSYWRQNFKPRERVLSISRCSIITSQSTNTHTRHIKPQHTRIYRTIYKADEPGAAGIGRLSHKNDCCNRIRLVIIRNLKKQITLFFFFQRTAHNAVMQLRKSWPALVSIELNIIHSPTWKKISFAKLSTPEVDNFSEHFEMMCRILLTSSRCTSHGSLRIKGISHAHTNEIH